VRGSDIVLPQIYWLDYLDVSRPQRTNGILVKNLDVYKAAWNMLGRFQASSSAPMGAEYKQ